LHLDGETDWRLVTLPSRLFDANLAGGDANRMQYANEIRHPGIARLETHIEAAPGVVAVAGDISLAVH
jgi:hypothetical protein